MLALSPDKSGLRLALSIRQPHAENILRGVKKIEYRSKRVSEKLIGRRFYIYAARRLAKGLEREAAGLPTGLIVGTARISHCTVLPSAFILAYMSGI